MKPPTIPELERIRERFDAQRIRDGQELADPLDVQKNHLDKTYGVGGDLVKADELVRRLVRRCLELEGFIQREG